MSNPIDGMPTAFRVAYTHGTGGQTFGLNSEYDALENIGHACGYVKGRLHSAVANAPCVRYRHNLIAISGIAALLGMRAAMQKHGIQGKVVLLGTPAEEGGVGKQLLYWRKGHVSGHRHGMRLCLLADGVE